MSLPPTSGATVALDRLVALAAVAGVADPAGLSRSDTGGLSGPKRGEGGDIFDLRPFQEGDDPRRIDPAATARSGRVQVRSRHEEIEQTVMLVADFRRPMLWGTRGRFRSVAAAEALAVEGWRTIAAGGRVGCVVLRSGEAEVHPPRPRDAAMLAIADVFARTHQAAMATPADLPGDPLSAGLEHAVSQVRFGASVIVATGFDDPGDDFAAVAAIAMRKCRLSILLVQDALESAPPAGVFTVRARGAITRGRFGKSTSAAHLDALGVKTRIVRAEQPAAPDGAHDT